MRVDVYKIWGAYSGRQEVLDQAHSRQAAERLLGEYRMVFGREWALWITEPR